MKSNSSSRNDATEKMLRRREWKLEQERQRQHERLKQKKIYEYEMQRAREKGLLPPKPPNRSKSRSKSPQSRPRRPCTPSSTNTPILFKRLESADGTVPLFKGPEGTKISATELPRIKVDIRRNIPGKSTDPDLQRDIINPEDVIVKRRTEGKSKSFKKHSTALSPIRNRSHSPRRTLSRHSRDEKYYREHRERSRERSRGRRRDRERSRDRRDRERSRDRRDRERSRDRRERERSRDRSDRDRFRKQRVSPPYYFEHIPVPMYYRHFPPNPIMMAPLMPIRRKVPLENRLSPMMTSVELLLPRFLPPNVNRLHTPFNLSHYRSKNF